ncbi:hypothetical protein SUGI_1424640 [Cryptomeria japonica]|uniref:Uncharacterized protein n=1 Tax=Cryptomeria japonica TaxID=3369 RepID=A0AAD3NME3_CRYJA|nr:hypothetical protein SUGI_1424640 [Cryptomeria japonica]
MINSRIWLHYPSRIVGHSFLLVVLYFVNRRILRRIGTSIGGSRGGPGYRLFGSLDREADLDDDIDRRIGTSIGGSRGGSAHRPGYRFFGSSNRFYT